MELKYKWLGTLAVLVLQLGVASHGWTAWQALERQPVIVRAGLVITREAPNGEWKPVGLSDVAAGDRAQINLATEHSVELFVLHLTGERDVVRLYPPPGIDSPPVAGEAYYSLPSPTTWYQVDQVHPGDRLVLIAARPRRAETLRGRLEAARTPAALLELRAELEARQTGDAEIFGVPLPDGGLVRARLQENRGVGSVWIEWQLQNTSSAR